MKQRSLFGRPIVEVDNMAKGEIQFAAPIEVQPVRVRPAVAASPTDPVRFVMEVKVRPGLHTMEEMREWTDDDSRS
jgi:hypothetical protein